MSRISGSEALNNARNNPNRAWLGVSSGSAQGRFHAGGFLNIRHKPKFSIGRDKPIYTMGSCFAREIENTLQQLKIPLVLNGHGVPAEEFETWDDETGRGGGVTRGNLSRGAYNKYTVPAMSHELRRVILDEQYENDGLIELETDRWFDPHASGLKSGPYAHIVAVRKTMHDAMAQIKQAKVVFLTLGLIEGWTDAQTGLALNRIPSGKALTRMADRFLFTVPTSSEVISELISTIELIRAKCDNEMHFIVTVSPVPFASTFRDQDVVVANTASKAILRTAADEICQIFDYVDYFPSYEMVMSSPGSLAWREDGLHVQPEMVKHVTSSFAAQYLQ